MGVIDQDDRGPVPGDLGIKGIRLCLIVDSLGTRAVQNAETVGGAPQNLGFPDGLCLPVRIRGGQGQGGSFGGRRGSGRGENLALGIGDGRGGNLLLRQALGSGLRQIQRHRGLRQGGEQVLRQGTEGQVYAADGHQYAAYRQPVNENPAGPCVIFAAEFLFHHTVSPFPLLSQKRMREKKKI